MLHLVELRANALRIATPTEPEPSKPAHELVFIAGEVGYQLDAEGRASKTTQCTVWRCVATVPSLTNLALCALSLLSQEQRALVLERLAEVESRP